MQFRRQAQPGREVPAGLEAARIGDKRPDGSSGDGANTGDGDQSPGRLTLAVVTTAFLSWNAWWMVRAHPHQNVYFNELAGGNLRARFELDYWGLGTRAALEYILQHDPADRVRVKAGSFLPLAQSLAMLTPDERRRIEIVTDDTGPHYLLNNFRSVGSATDAQYRERYDLIHEIKVADLPILEIYRSQ